MKGWSRVQNSMKTNNSPSVLPAVDLLPRKPSSHFVSLFNHLGSSTHPTENKQWEPCEEKVDEHTDETKRVKDIMKTFCSETSAHGLPHLVKGTGWNLLRVIWLVIFTGAMAGECYHLVVLIQQYLQYPSMDSFRVSNKQPTFPAITLCNSDPFSDIGYWYSGDTPSFDHYYYWAGDVPQDEGHTFWNRINSAKGVFENVNRTELMLLGHQLRDFIMFCSYRGIPCDYDRDFVRFENPTYYNCFTYNVPDVPVDVGPDKGLALVLFLEGNPDSASGEKLFTRDSNVEQSVGARLEIHEKNNLPNPVLSGINIPPGHSTALSLKQSTREKLGNPYSSCESRDSLADMKNYRYSTKGCYDVCKLQYVYDNCGCVNPDTPIPDSLRDTSVGFCGTYNESYFNTTDGLVEWMNNVMCEKNTTLAFSTKVCDHPGYHSCREPCKYSTYEVAISQAVWPSVVTLRDAYYDFVEGWKAFEILSDAYVASRYNESREELRDLMWYNLARVNIYFNEARIINIKEVRSMSLTDLFSGIGGTIGLWAGLSVITILEFLSLPIQLFYFYFNRANEKPSKTKVMPIH